MVSIMKSETRLILYITLLGLFTLTLCVPHGVATTGWNRAYGGTVDDMAYSVVQTSDGGYALAGFTRSYGAGAEDFWLVRTDSSGNIQWNKTYGGAADDTAYSLVQTSDGGYALAGCTNSYRAGDSAYLVKTDASGNVQWNQTYGGGGDDYYAYSLVQTSDGGYAMAGSLSHIYFWLVRTDSSGNMQWNQTCGDSLGDANSVVQTSDGGYALAGSYGSDFSLAKTDSSGNTKWSQTYGSTPDEKARSVVQTSDGGYALAGCTGSEGTGHNGFYLIKTDSSGNMQWNQTYGGITTDDSANSVIQTSDGGYALAGISEIPGQKSFWLIKVDSSGNMQWNQTYEGGEGTCSLVQTRDGGYAMAGDISVYVPRDYPDVGYWQDDFWLVKTDAAGAIPEFPSFVALLLLAALATLVVLVYTRRRLQGNMRKPVFSKLQLGYYGTPYKIRLPERSSH
jgi:hypothetical protein